MKKHDIVLLEKPGISGLTKDEVCAIFDELASEEAYPIEILALEHESSAMGFISVDAAEKLEYDYEASGLNPFVAEILDDMGKENEDGVYDFSGISVKITR